MTSDKPYDHIFTSELSEQQLRDWMLLYDDYENAPMTQYPDWLQLAQPTRKVTYFLLYSENELLAVSTIVENKIVANVLHGPLSKSEESYAEAVLRIRNYYKSKKKFAELRVTQPETVSETTENLEYTTYKKIVFKQFLNDKNLFSIAVNLALTSDDLLRSFNRSNRNGVRKALKSGYEVSEIVSESDAIKFASIFDSMIKSRGIENQFLDTAHSFKEMLSLFNREKVGKMLSISDADGTMMGGIVLLFQGDYVLYDIGASDPEFRKNPIMHLLLYKAMILAKERGFQWLDLGGYNLMASEKDQVTNINKFKAGFNGEPRIYPKKMYFTLNPLVSAVLSVRNLVKKYLNK